MFLIIVFNLLINKQHVIPYETAILLNIKLSERRKLDESGRRSNKFSERKVK